MSLKSIFSKLAFSKGGTTLDKVIQRLIYILIFLFPLWFLPLTINAVEFNKQVLLVLFVVVTFILWLIKILNQGEVRWKSNILNIFLGLFLVVYILATIFSSRPYGSLVGWPTHLSGSLVNILCFLGLYLLIINNFKGLKDTFNLLFVFLVSSAITTIIGLIQIWGGFIFPWSFTKITSFNMVGTVNSLGIFSAMVLTLVTALLFVIKKTNIKIFLVLLGLLNLILLISLNFWVLWLILIVGLAIILVLGLMRIVKLEESVSWLAWPIAILAIALIFLFFRPTLPLRTNLPVEVGLNYKGGLEVVKKVLQEKPILGTGPESFVLNYTKYKSSTINQTAFWNVRFANPPGEIYSITSDLGIIGLISFLIILVLFIIKAITNLIKTVGEGDNILKQFLEIGVFAGWLGLAVGLFLYPQSLTLMFSFWLLFSIYLAESSVFKEKVYNLRKSPAVLLTASFSFVIIIVLMVGFIYVEGTRFVAEVVYKNGLDLIQIKGNLDEGINKVVRATVINPYEDRTYNVLSQLFILKMNRDAQLGGVTQQERANLIQVDAINAINSAVRATILSPKDVANWLIRGQVYGQVISFISGAADWAETSYEEAIKLEPLNPFIYTEWGRVLVNRATLLAGQGKRDRATQETINNYLGQALEKFNRAIEIKSNYAPALFESARVYESQGKLKEAIARMEINRQLLPRDTGIAFQLGVLYYKAEKYSEAKGEFIRAVVLDDNFSNARYFLGLLYDREGDKESALDQFERIALLNPDNEHIKDVIANLKAGLPALGSAELGPPEQPVQIPIEQQPVEE
ncbi:MAG: tetratricopeptide repeat protein [Patescibacteria group bacterium]